jgi:ATP-dependent DNA helicase RecG
MNGDSSSEQNRDIDLLESLLALQRETEWIEFKENNDDPELIAKVGAAVANSAAYHGKSHGYIIWGIRDQGLQVVGTSVDLKSKRVENQPFEIWLANKLRPSVPFEVRSISYKQWHVVLLQICAPTTIPVAVNGSTHIRIGEATTLLTNYPDRFAQLIEKMRPYNWEKGIARQYVEAGNVLNLLDHTQYFRLLGKPLPDGNQSIMEHLEADALVMKDVGGKWNITNLGAILLAYDLNAFDASLARKGVRLVAYSGHNKASIVVNRQDGRRGYASGFQGLVDYINTLLPKNEHIGDAFREEQKLFPEVAIRELVANALIHQDMTVSGAGPQVEIFSDRIEIVNPGKPLMRVDRMIDLPPRSRNEALASLMRRMRICEEQGSGLDKVIASVELFQLPPPAFRESDGSMQVVLYGPRSFAEMTVEERVRACYHHAVLKLLGGEKMRNQSLCARFGIDPRNAAQASAVIKQAQDAQFIKPADPEHPRAGYVPGWA